MFRGNYQKTNNNGNKFYYKFGDVVNYQGSLYKATKPTMSSPFQDGSSWEYLGLSELFSSPTPPINPKEGQYWERDGVVYYYFYDGNNYSWVQF
jgi:hypothetical protein